MPGTVDGKAGAARETPYIPAMNYDWLTPFYDPFMRLMGERKLKLRLCEMARVVPGNKVLDVGCGTGTLLELLKIAAPGAMLYGFDGDFRILRIAYRKIRKHNLDIVLSQALAQQLPYPDAVFDCVLSSLVFHHLDTEIKRQAFREVLRVLRPGGMMIIADFGPPVGTMMKMITALMKNHECISDNLKGLLPAFAGEAGFIDIQMTKHINTIFGTVWILEGMKHA